MGLVRRLLSPVGFALVGLCLLLPFVERPHETSTSEWALIWSGGDLVTGGDSELWFRDLETERQGRPSPSSEEMAQVMPQFRVFVPAQPLLMVAAVALVGGALSWLVVGVRSRTRVALGAGVASLAALVAGEWLAARWVASISPADFPDPGYGYALNGFTVAPGYGFWIAAGLLLVLSVGNGVAAHRLRPARSS